MSGSGQAIPDRRSSLRNEPLQRPLVVCCCVVVPATALGIFQPLPPWPMLGLCLLILLAWRKFQARRGVALLPWLLLGSVVALYASHRTFSISADDLSQHMERPAERLFVRGVIAGEVGIEEENGEVRVRFPLRIEQIRRTGAWESASGTLAVRLQGSLREAVPGYGERWEMEGIVRRRDDVVRRSAAMRPYFMRAESDAARRLEGWAGSRFRAWSLERRQVCARILGLGLEEDPDGVGLLRALLLGYREELPDAHERVFSRTGMLHIFAVSGLHVGVMASLAIALLQALGLPRHRWALVLAPLLVFYTVLTGMKPSAVRACIMALAYWSAAPFWRRPDAPSALALACMALLLWNPLQLVAPGFLLSFSVVTGLVVLGAPLFERMSAGAMPDPFDLAPRGPLQRATQYLLRSFAALASTSVVAWCCSAPLIAWVFSLFSPIAILGNLLVVPMAFVMVLTGCLSLITGGLSVWSAEVFNHANRFFFSVVLVWIDWMDRVPGGHTWIPAPSLWSMGFWFAGLLSLRFARRAPMRAVAWGVLGILLLSRFGTWGGAARETHVANLDGEIAVIWLERSGEGVLLTDARSAWHAREIERRLQRLGVDRIRVVIALRGGCAGSLLPVLKESFRIDEWWTPDWRDDAALGEELPTMRVLKGGERGFLPCGTQWEVLVPTDAHRPEGRGGLSVRLGRGARSLIVAGVGGFAVKDAMLASDRLAGAKAVVLAPGALEGLMSARWLDWARPEAVVICVGPVRWVRDDHAALRRLLEAHEIESLFLEPGEAKWLR